MRALMNIVEAAVSTPAQAFLDIVQADERCAFCEFEAKSADVIFLTWLDGEGGLVPYLTSVADQMAVTLEFMVDVYGKDDGGRLVAYYAKHGFQTLQSDFPDDHDFDAMPTHGDNLLGQVVMLRQPAE